MSPLDWTERFIGGKNYNWKKRKLDLQELNVLPQTSSSSAQQLSKDTANASVRLQEAIRQRLSKETSTNDHGYTDTNFAKQSVEFVVEHPGIFYNQRDIEGTSGRNLTQSHYFLRICLNQKQDT